ncbi:uncharacterized protein LOC127259915 isoform X2 [Andrographis paniculata]|uniref:uncharacterized protein LOC127259915 isoform X2 n=1 Tax=Andrographis paniculata TaxID=175694 RepID=UPI0021E93C09|nr:uncharacterized protein LOC127259915 isoform X2 [Andrographis paniculata]
MVKSRADSAKEGPSVLDSSLSPSPFSPIDAAAEEAAEQILNCVHPTLDSEEKRRDVIDYVQQLINTCAACQVVAYGSVPLKTYLPDGDIDLTVLVGPDAEESPVHSIFAALQAEERNTNSEYEFRETRLIDAEVKIVKCLVQNIVIDISFDQLGGLSTLCFLEEVDRRVGRDHLFKRGIILVKTWCYYESRIHGAHHGLFSTYALEVLILYIFQFFHSSLTGPLSVLYKFLDYYSQFDWGNYGISLKGLVRNSSLPKIAVEVPEGGGNKLLADDFLERCTEMYAVPSREVTSRRNIFRIKHLNIVDPLREDNNLGRSIHRGNFYRIQSALKYGARKLGQILSHCPKDEISSELNKFFANTHSRHEHPYTSRIPDLVPELNGEESWISPDLPKDSPYSDVNCDYLAAREIALLEVPFKTESTGCLKNDPSLPCCSRKSKIDSEIMEGGELEVFNPLADLTGDYESHVRSLLCGQFRHLSTAAPSSPPSQPSLRQNRSSQTNLSQNGEGIGTQKVSRSESNERTRNEVGRYHNNRLRHHGQRYSFDNSSWGGFLLARSRHSNLRLSGSLQYQYPPRFVEEQNQATGHLYSCRIQFGSFWSPYVASSTQSPGAYYMLRPRTETAQQRY